jgi:hypothetical protein
MSDNVLNKALRIMGCETGPGGDHSCEARNTRLDRGLLARTVLGGSFPLLSR